ncbi:hypothetical protein KP509_33G056500 [Ceratopteris richardii]|nr:hypothetical protein KP509_33G056500 [Ceratopteris richardii]
MQNNGISPNATTFVCALKACCRIKVLSRGQEIHSDIEKMALQVEFPMVGNALVDMYIKCGSLEMAQYMFNHLSHRDIVTWNSMITGFAEQGRGEEGLKCFEQMKPRGILPDPITLASSLKACTTITALHEGSVIHAEVERLGLLEKDLYLGSALIDMYAKTGLLSRAQEVFDKLPLRGIVAWTALIAGYAVVGSFEKTLICLDQMQFEGFIPNNITLIWCLKACQSPGAGNKGIEIHAEIERRGMLDHDLVGNTLVDMYAKCGLVDKACQTFDKLPLKDVVSWTALMVGFVQIGESGNAFRFFDQMVMQGIRPNAVTFSVVLSACIRIGIFSKCRTYFEAMRDDFGIISGLEHTNCVAYLLSHAGQVENALAMINLFPNLVAWQSVLGACRRLGNTDFGKEAFRHLIH